MRLYEIDQEIEALAELVIDPETGEINEEIEKEIDALSMERDEKIENLILWVKNIRSDVAALKVEKESFDKRIKTSTNKADRIEAYIATVLAGEKFETTKAKVTWRKSERIEITDKKLIPEDCRLYETDFKPVKSLIKERIKNGEDIPGAVLVESNNLQIK